MLNTAELGPMLSKKHQAQVKVIERKVSDGVGKGGGSLD